MNEWKMKMENIMSRKRLIRTGFPYDAYKYIDKPGQYMAILDAKCWGHNNLLLFFTLTDYNYKTIITGAWRNTNYYCLRNVPAGSKVLLLFRRAKTTGNVYMAGAEVIEAEQESIYGEDV